MHSKISFSNKRFEPLLRDRLLKEHKIWLRIIARHPPLLKLETTSIVKLVKKRVHIRFSDKTTT